MATTTLPSSHGSDTLLKQNGRFEYAPLHRKRTSTTSIITRIGYYSSGMLFMGSLAILAGFAYISFLWWSRASLWSQIVLNTWVAPSVTLASLVIRTSIAFQAVICTAMIAVLALRWHQVSVTESAAISLFRFTNPGPSALLSPLCRSYKAKFPLAGLLILLLTLITISSNTISTFLVSDLDIAVLSGDYSSTVPAFGVNITKQRFKDLDYFDAGPSFYRRKPEQYPSFAERTLTSVKNSSGLYDTGIILRAFLPFSSGIDRSHIKYFNGTAASLMTRTVCAKPKYDITIEKTDEFPELSHEGIRIMGNISIDPMADGELNTSAVGRVDCFLGNSQDINVCQICGPGFSSYQCGSNKGSRPIDDFNLIQFDTDDPMMKFQSGLGPIRADTYLVWYGYSLNEEKTDSNDQAEPEDSLEWTSFDHPIGESNLKSDLSRNTTYGNATYITGCMTLCMTTTLDQYMNISASRPLNISEPSIDWNKSVNESFSDTIDTAPILKQLGVTGDNFSLQERGLLSLDSWSHPTYMDTYFTGLEPKNTSRYSWAGFFQGVEVNWTNADDSTDSGGGFDSYLFAILNDTFTSTNHPALMFQAVNTMLYSMAYYNEYVAFDLYDSSTRTQYFVQALQPVKKRGYWAVTSIIVCHFILISIIIVLYISGGGDGDVLGQAWVIVSQLKSEEVELICHSNDTMMDRDVKRLLEENALAHRRVGLVNCRDREYMIRSFPE